MTHPAQMPATQGSPVAGAKGQDVPEGWKLVPIEPTPEMVAAMAVVRATSVHQEDGRKYHCVGMSGACEAYEAMLAATPDPASPAPSVEPVAWMLVDRTNGVESACAGSEKPIACEAFWSYPLFTSPSPSPSQGEALDAARYRWLRDNVSETPLRPASFGSVEFPDMRLRFDFPTLVSYDAIGQQITLDDAIDAAMRKGD